VLRQGRVFQMTKGTSSALARLRLKSLQHVKSVMPVKNDSLEGYQNRINNHLIFEWCISGLSIGNRIALAGQ
jgi:hypothetical protein